MAQITNEELIKKARSGVNPRKIAHGFTVGDVACALLTSKGNIFLGVCIDTCSGMGFCAEHSAVAAMVTAGEHKIRKIVAVDRDGIPLSPCGRCREFIHQIHEDNLNTEIVVAPKKSIKLKELLPHRWD